MNIVRLYPGKEREVFAIARPGKEVPIFVEELYEYLSQTHIDKVESYIQHLGDIPAPIQNSSSIKKLRHRPSLWELIPKPVRLFFFFVHQKQVIITNGFDKKRNDTPLKHIQKAEALMEKYKREE